MGFIFWDRQGAQLYSSFHCQCQYLEGKKLELTAIEKHLFSEYLVFHKISDVIVIQHCANQPWFRVADCEDLTQGKIPTRVKRSFA